MAAAVLLASGCAAGYKVAGVERTALVVDGRYDGRHDAEAEAFLAAYSAKVDSAMGRIVGRTARELTSGRPESPMSNLMADVLAWAAGSFGEKPDFAVYNIGGIRASIPVGEISFGQVVASAPFENRICFTTLTGRQVERLLAQVARNKGEGISSSVRLLATGDSLVAAAVGGKRVDPSATYRVATLDYLAQGNDGLTEFAKGGNVYIPGGDNALTRNILAAYFSDMAAKGLAVDAAVEGRMVFLGKGEDASSAAEEFYLEHTAGREQSTQGKQ